MSTASLLRVPSERPTISFELYPPRSQKGERTLHRAIAELATAQPDFFSVTYGAAGSTRETSRQVIRRILRTTEVTPIAHLTCVGATAEELRAVVADLLDEGVRDFLALRGDPPAGEPDWQPHPEGLSRSSELVSLLRTIEAERFGTPTHATAQHHGAPTAQHHHAASPLSICVATYPGQRRDAGGRAVVDPRDIDALVEKQDAGADFAITQIFYDAAHYVELRDRARQAGVNIPILPGVIPFTDPRRLRKLADLTGVKAPESLLATLEGASSPQEAYRFGIRASGDLITQTLQAGAPGLHVYTFNQARPALDLLHGAGLRPAPSMA